MVPGADLAGLELAGGDGDEVRLDGDLLQEAVEPLLAAVDWLGIALGHSAHQHSQVGGGSDLEIFGLHRIGLRTLWLHPLLYRVSHPIIHRGFSA